jgi:two-component system, NtrC family, response regulator HydG
MLPRAKIMVVDDEPAITGAMAMILGERGYKVAAAATAARAVELLNEQHFDLVFTDLRLPDASGMDLLAQVKADSPATTVILMTAHGSLDITIEAIKEGAYYYLDKPFTPDQAMMLVERALQFVAIHEENRHLKRILSGGHQAFGIIGLNEKMRRIYETIRMTAASDASVLIEGESGTGKELIAAAFHLQSERASRPFTRINCAAIPGDLIESELFGYKKGAFTGADRDRHGLIEATAGGTLLLDEIAEMPVHLQTKLLRVLQDRSLHRLGDNREVRVDFRLLAATNRDTRQALREGRLRDDLYFRINTIKVQVPPLRERLDDLALLAEHFLQRYVVKYHRRIRGISPAAFSLLSKYDWPGNVRELESAIERAVLFCDRDLISPMHLPEHLQAARPRPMKCEIPAYLTLEEIEQEAIRQTLERTRNNVKKTAQILNLHRPTLYRKLKKFGLRADRSQ